MTDDEIIKKVSDRMHGVLSPEEEYLLDVIQCAIDDVTKVYGAGIPFTQKGMEVIASAACNQLITYKYFIKPKTGEQIIANNLFMYTVYRYLDRTGFFGGKPSQRQEQFTKKIEALKAQLRQYESARSNNPKNHH